MVVYFFRDECAWLASWNIKEVFTVQAVADIIRTTLGPRSMLKMLLDATGGTSFVTCRKHTKLGGCSLMQDNCATLVAPPRREKKLKLVQELFSPMMGMPF